MMMIMKLSKGEACFIEFQFKVVISVRYNSSEGLFSKIFGYDDFVSNDFVITFDGEAEVERMVVSKDVEGSSGVDESVKLTPALRRFILKIVKVKAVEQNRLIVLQRFSGLDVRKFDLLQSYTFGLSILDASYLQLDSDMEVQGFSVGTFEVDIEKSLLSTIDVNELKLVCQVFHGQHFSEVYFIVLSNILLRFVGVIYNLAGKNQVDVAPQRPMTRKQLLTHIGQYVLVLAAMRAKICVVSLAKNSNIEHANRLLRYLDGLGDGVNHLVLFGFEQLNEVFERSIDQVVSVWSA